MLVYFCSLSYTLSHFLIMELTLSFESLAYNAKWHVVKTNTSDSGDFGTLKSRLKYHKLGKELSEVLRELDTTFSGDAVGELSLDLK